LQRRIRQADHPADGLGLLAGDFLIWMLRKVGICRRRTKPGKSVVISMASPGIHPW
jgi:hypothetical protein